MLDVTATPLPQSPPPPPTPLQAHRLATILHGSFEVSAEVVTVTVPRRRGVVIDGVHVDPDTNIETNIQFRLPTRRLPLQPGDRRAPAFSHMLKVGDPYDLAAEIRAGSI